VTSSFPSERVVVPRSDAVTPLPAFGVPLVRNGGQALAQAPEHVLFEPVSFSNRYRVRPCESTRILPRPVLLTFTVAALAELDCFAIPAFERPSATTGATGHWTVSASCCSSSVRSP
jgi:hypothetical protein